MMIKTGFATIVLLLLSSTAFAAESRATVSEDDERIVLEYDRAVRAIIEPRHGGELAGLSVFMRGEWHELIYRAADYSEQPGWRGKAPLLWPATGVSISESGGRGSYMAGVGLYKMPMHGFARAQAWRIVETTSGANSAAATLELVDTDASRRLYPFGFSLRAEYRVDPCGLEIRYHVAASADNEAPMPFSIGNHVTFRLPLVNGSAPEATTFRTNLPQEYIIDAKRVFTGQARPSRLTGTHRVGELPQRRAVSLGGGVAVPRVTVADSSGLSVTISHEVPEGAPERTILFNLWADLEEGFFSPEPWIGAQNSLNSGYGLVRLSPGRDWHWPVRIQPSTLEHCDSKAASS